MNNRGKINYIKNLPSNYTLQSQGGGGVLNLHYNRGHNNFDYRRSKNNNAIKYVGVILTIVALIIVLPKAFGALFHHTTEITIQVHDAEMYVNEEKPDFSAELICKDNTSKVLDDKSGITVQSLLDNINRGDGYTLASDGDGTNIGEFPIKCNLAGDIQNTLDGDLKDKVNFVVKLGTFRVKEIDEAHAKELADKAKAAYEQPMLALTFDDGPGPYTDDLLECFEKHDARATFFMVGKNIPNYPDAVKKMGDIGCEFGNHSYDHAKLTKLSIAEIQAEISQTNEAVQNITGRPSTVLRVPYGATNDAVNGACGMPMIQWSVDTLDWKTRSTEATVENVLNFAEDGDIILLHDIHETSVEAAKQLIPALQERGFKLVTVSELAKARGHKLENGNTYFSFHKGE